MKIIKKRINLSKAELDEMNAIISGKTEIVGEHTIQVYTAKFPEGIEVDIKICGVKESEDEDCTPYIDAVIFQNGQEITCLEPAFEHLEGEYIFELDDTTYTVIIGHD